MEWKRVAPKVDWKEATTDPPEEDCSAECWVAKTASRTGAQRAATWGLEMAASSVPSAGNYWAGPTVAWRADAVAGHSADRKASWLVDWMVRYSVRKSVARTVQYSGYCLAYWMVCLSVAVLVSWSEWILVEMWEKL